MPWVENMNNWLSPWKGSISLGFMFSFSQTENLIYSFALPQGFISFCPVLLSDNWRILSVLSSSSFINSSPSLEVNIRREAPPTNANAGRLPLKPDTLHACMPHPSPPHAGREPECSDRQSQVIEYGVVIIGNFLLHKVVNSYFNIHKLYVSHLGHFFWLGVAVCNRNLLPTLWVLRLPVVRQCF